MTIEAQKEAREEAERRWPMARYEPTLTPGAVRNARRQAFEDGAAWQASRAPQPTEDDREALIDAMVMVETPSGLVEFYDTPEDRNDAGALAEAILAAGFRRAPAEPAVQGDAKLPQNSEPTDEAVEAFTVAINRAGYVLDRNATRVGLRAALSTERGEPRGPEPVRFDPPLTRAEADAFWDAITDESPDQDQPDRSK